ncbi:MAG: arginase [Candidatus Obscuribacterales bacterium]
MSAPKASSSSLVANSETKFNRSVTLIYCPIHLGGPHAGVALGPGAMKVARLVSRIKDLGYTVHKEVEISVPEVLTWWEKNTNALHSRCVPEIAAVSQAVAQAVEEALDAGTVAITIGGDHSLAIGSIAGVSNYYRKRQEEFGLVWFDAHGDINTPATSPSGNVHGMPFAISLGQGDESLVNLNGFSPKVKAKRCSLIGIRDLDQAETDLVRDSGVLPFTMRDVDEQGIKKITEQALQSIGRDIHGLHVSFDLDVIDPDVAPGVSTDSRGGFTYRESHFALELLADTKIVRSIDIVELNPTLDIKNRTAELAVDLVQSALGKNIL